MNPSKPVTDSDPAPRPKRETLLSELGVVVLAIIFFLGLLWFLGASLSWWLAPATVETPPVGVNDLASRFRKIGMEVGLDAEGKIQVITTPYPLLVTDNDLAKVTGLPELQVLDLKGTQISDDALKHLKDLPKLRELFLGGSIITEIEPEFLGPQITNTGLKELQDLKGLKLLSLARTDVNDQGLKHLLPLTELQVLFLLGTNVSDAGIDDLAQLSNLKEIFLHDTKVTQSGIQKLQAALPNTKIGHNVILKVAEPEEDSLETS